MGKLKKRSKNNKSRLNPVKGKSTDDSKDESTRQTKVLPLIEKLSSSISNDKLMALGAITVLTDDPRLRLMFLKEKLVSIIMEKCLSDSSDEIVVESFGLLRNLGIEEGYEVLIHYWRSGIWTSIEAAITQIQKSYSFLIENNNPVDKDKSKLQLLFDFTENILSLIVTLACGSEDLFTQVLSKIDPILLFVSAMVKNQVGTGSFKVSNQLFIALIEFIYEFSIESDEFIQKANFDYQAVQAYLENTPALAQTSAGGLIQVYLEGTKFNNLEIAGQTVPVAESLTTTSNVLTSINLSLLKESIVKFANPDNSKPIVKDDSTIIKELNKDTKEKSQAKQELSTIETSLDLISSLLEYNANQDQNILILAKEKVYDVVLALIQFEVSNENVLSLLNKMLVAMNNFIWLLNSKNVDEFDSTELWNLLAQLSSTDVEVQRNVLSIMNGCFRLHDFSESSIAVVLPLIERAQSIQDSEDEESLRLYLTVVELLGLITAKVDNKSTATSVGPFLIGSVETFLNKANPLGIEIVLLCLDSVYDIFGSDNQTYDALFISDNYNAKLIEIEAQLKAVYKTIDKNKYSNLKMRAEEVLNNLGSFIEYKG